MKVFPCSKYKNGRTAAKVLHERKPNSVSCCQSYKYHFLSEAFFYQRWNQGRRENWRRRESLRNDDGSGVEDEKQINPFVKKTCYSRMKCRFQLLILDHKLSFELFATVWTRPLRQLRVHHPHVQIYRKNTGNILKLNEKLDMKIIRNFFSSLSCLDIFP